MLTYRGIEIHQEEVNGTYFAGFIKNPQYVFSKISQEDAICLLKEEIDKFHPSLLDAYTKHPKLMRELEDM